MIVLQARALGVVEPARDAEPLAAAGRRRGSGPGSEISVVSRAPFVFIGSLTAWTSDLLAARDQVLDLLAVVPLALELRARRSRRRRGSRSSRGRSRRTRPPCRGGRCRRCRGRCCRRSSGARGARGRPRRRGRPRGSATRCSPTSTEISSSRLAFGSGARFCGTRRRCPAGWRGAPAAGCAALAGAGCPGCAGRPRRLARAFAPAGWSGFVRLVGRRASAPATAPGFLRPRPPRLPRRRFLAGSVAASAPASAEPSAAGGSAGAAGLLERAPAAAACSVVSLRFLRNQGDKCFS